MTLALGLALIAALAGFYSAWFWWKSAAVKFESRITTVFIEGQPAGGSIDVERFVRVTGQLNQRAAIGSAVAVCASALSALASAWPS